ncbi:hypothetical protein JCM11641_003271 [Rhodosporidiobolus odoratus]
MLCGSQHHPAVDCPLHRWALPQTGPNRFVFFPPPPDSTSFNNFNFLDLLHFPYFSLYIRDFQPLCQNVLALYLPSLNIFSKPTLPPCSKAATTFHSSKLNAYPNPKSSHRSSTLARLPLPD